jgi:hypothetical protein
LALGCTQFLQAKRGILTAPVGEARHIRKVIKVFADFFIHRTSLLAEYELQDKYFWRSIRNMKNRQSMDTYTLPSPIVGKLAY